MVVWLSSRYIIKVSQVGDGDQYREIEFRTAVHTASGAFFRTMIVDILPCYIFVSRLKRALYMQQDFSDIVLELEPECDRYDFVWPNSQVQSRTLRYRSYSLFILAFIIYI